MDTRLKTIKDRIQALRNRNKQIDTEKKITASEDRKTTLNDEKEQNNDELRKQRTQRYEIEQTNAETSFIKECCMHLQGVGLIKSQHDFCRNFLSKSENYLSMLICENRKPPLDLLNILLENLKILCSAFMNSNDNDKISERLTPLIIKGQAIITNRLSKYIGGMI